MNARIKQVSIPQITGFVGLATALTTLFFWPDRALTEPAADYTVKYLLIVFSAMAFVELAILRSFNAVGSGLNYDLSNFTNPKYTRSLFVKLVGLAATMVLVTLFYFTADIYSSTWYSPFFTFLFDHGKLITVIVLSYFTMTHYFLKNPHDSYWHMGRFVLSFGHETAPKILRNHVVAMAVKVFFLPLMFCYAVYDLAYLINFDYRTVDSFPRFYSFSYRLLFFMDITIVVIGYTFSLRLFNAHIRWPETSIGGWLVCILCYMPFWQLFRTDYLDYFSGGISWGEWLNGSPVLYTFWGSTILLLMLFYMYAATQFGMRFSNLTYRGLISDGVYGLTKHPSYISKNITWWMISIPFVADDWRSGAANCFALAGVNLIYYMRAKYEERCLSPSPSYRIYMDYININGLIPVARRRIARLIGIGSKKILAGVRKGNFSK